jgi:glycine C-acetyltransferase
MQEALRSFLRAELDTLRERHLFRPLRIVYGEQKPFCNIDGKEVINLSSNNYLGLTTHPRMREAAIKAVEEYGAGSGAVRTIIGTQDLHEELERRLAAFKHVEAVLTFQSGFTANTGTIAAIMGEGDAIITDELNHASIIDGVRLTKATRYIYRHSDMNHLEEQLKAAREAGAKKMLVITDGVFSMDGDIAKLPDIVNLSDQFGASVYVDDAHSSGVLGENGRGSINHFGLDGRVDIQVGTLSKALGVLGGYVASSQDMRDYLIHRARPILFSTSHPPAVVAPLITAIDIMEQEPELIEQLWTNTRHFKAGLTRLGFDTGHSETPITPVIAGSAERAGRLSDRLFEEGVFAQAIGFPTVPDAKSRVRTIVTAAHTRAQLDTALAAFERVGREIGLI